MSTFRTKAIVLRRTNYGEADRIVQLLTPEGKRSVMARGVRREKSKLAGGIELFAESDVVIHEGKGELGILTSARLIYFYRHILDDYDKMQFGYEAIKHVARASEMVDEPQWYDILFEVLAGLDTKTIPLKLVETWFYLHVAALLGYELSFMHDTEGRVLNQNNHYTYDVGEKGFRPTATGEITADHIKFMRLVSSKSLRAVSQVGGIESVLSDAYLIARQHVAL